jgi:hypothetical protein
VVESTGFSHSEVIRLRDYALRVLLPLILICRKPTGPAAAHRNPFLSNKKPEILYEKLTFVATAVMAFVCNAMAQSTVSHAYGLRMRAIHVSGLKNGSFNRLASGIMEGSFRGGNARHRGSGGGYKAILRLSRFERHGFGDESV